MVPNPYLNANPRSANPAPESREANPAVPNPASWIGFVPRATGTGYGWRVQVRVRVRGVLP